MDHRRTHADDLYSVPTGERGWGRVHDVDAGGGQVDGVRGERRGVGDVAETRCFGLESEIREGDGERVYGDRLGEEGEVGRGAGPSHERPGQRTV